MTSSRLQEKWLAVEQMAYALGGIARQTMTLSQMGEKLNLADKGLDLAATEKQFKEFCTLLMQDHGREMKPQAKFTLVTKEANSAGRFYRLGEYRLFIGQWGTIVVKCQPTDDQLDIDPTRVSEAYYVADDNAMRATEDATELKNLLKQFVQTQIKGASA